METDAWGLLLDTSAAVCCKPGNLASARGLSPGPSECILGPCGLTLGTLFLDRSSFLKETCQEIKKLRVQTELMSNSKNYGVEHWGWDLKMPPGWSLEGLESHAVLLGWPVQLF